MVPAMYMANAQVLALLAAGLYTGLVLDIGDGVAWAVPIYEGHHIPHCVVKADIGGRDVTDYIMKVGRTKFIA